MEFDTRYLYEHLQEMLALVSNQELSKQAI